MEIYGFVQLYICFISSAYPWPETFNTTYDCMTFGYEESLNKMREIGREDVNEHGIYIRFLCTPEETI